jgi:hypothetical protein
MMTTPVWFPRLAAVCVSIALVAVASLASATVMVEIPLEDLVRDADVIVHGTVERVGVRLHVDERGANPHTISVLRVRESLKGPAQVGELVAIDEMGGVIGDRGMRIDGTPTYVRGEEAIVFLHRVDGRLRTLQMCQGHFVIRRGVPGTDDVVLRDLSAVGLAAWDTGEMTVEHGGRRAMPLRDFVGWIRSALEQGAIVEGATVPSATVPRATSPLGGGR